jgi:hypothetical protein
MTQQDDTGARNRIEAVEAGGRWFLRRCGTQFWGEGPTLAEAHDELRRREADYHAFLEKARIPPIPVTGLKRWAYGAARPAGRLFAALAIFALLMVPVSYAISTGIGRGIKQAEIKVGGKEFWTALDRRVMELSEERYDLPPDQAERLRLAIRRIVARFRPFASEIGQLFEPVEQSAPAAEKR